MQGNSCGKILWENLDGEFLREILAGKSCGKILQENSCVQNIGVKFSLEILVGTSCAVKSCRQISAWENLVANSCGKFLWENLDRKILQENLVEII